MWVTCFFFFKRKTAYEVRISDWSSDVCSPDRESTVDPGAFLGSRDRSWGIRGVGEPEGGAPGTALPQFFWLWAPLNFEDGASHFDVNEDPRGDRRSDKRPIVRECVRTC